MGTPAENAAYWRRRLAGQGNLTAPKSTIGTVIEEGVRKAAKAAGAGERSAARFARRATNFLNDATPVGNVTGADDGQRQFRRGVTKGELGTAATGLAAFLLSAAPLPGGVKKPAKKGIADLIGDNSGAVRAWHGSPHDFDKFDMAMLGTGEGNHAFGRGLYFAERPGVASSYVQPRGAEPLDVPPEVTQRLRSLLAADDYLGFDTFGQAVHAVRSNPLDFDRAWEVSDPAGLKAALDAYDSAKWPQGKRPRLYEVDINAEPSDFADYDALGPKSEWIAREEGLPGLRFLDQNSRMRGYGSHNYVVFDPSIIDILNKY